MTCNGGPMYAKSISCTFKEKNRYVTEANLSTDIIRLVTRAIVFYLRQ